MRKSRGRFALAFAVLGLMAGRSEAGLVAYTETGFVDGSLGNLSFNDASITITQVADTANIGELVDGFYNVLDSTATMTITGGGLTSPISANLTTPTYTFADQGFDFGGLYYYDSEGNLDALLALTSSAFAGYELQAPFGPISGPAAIGDGLQLSTDRGNVILDIRQVTATFTAASVPEPSSFVLCGTASIIGLGVARARRERAARDRLCRRIVFSRIFI
jgi:hypothetical protein